jgi:hypothetical protein
LPVLKARIDSIRFYFENNAFPGDEPPAAVEEPVEEDEGILLYPNPCRDFTSLQIPGPRPQNLLVEIYDMSGRKILSKQIVSDAIDVSSLSPGLYLARIIYGYNSCTKKLIVKN